MTHLAIVYHSGFGHTAVVAEHIAKALDRPLLPVSTLAALAMRAQARADGDRILATIDARMGEVYLGAFARNGDDLFALSDEVVVKPDAAIPTTANEAEIDLPRGLLEAVDLFEDDGELREMLGETFVATYAAIKRAEFETFMEVISPWEREFLLLNV